MLENLATFCLQKLNFDTTKFSDEYCKYGEFTGTMVGITCADRVKHRHYADYDFFEYIDIDAACR